MVAGVMQLEKLRSCSFLYRICLFCGDAGLRQGHVVNESRYAGQVMRYMLSRAALECAGLVPQGCCGCMGGIGARGWHTALINSKYAPHCNVPLQLTK